MITAQQLDSFRKKLQWLRANLDVRAASLRDEAFHGVGGEDSGGSSHAPLHLADLGSEEAGVAVNLELAANEAVLRQEIGEALFRLENGLFGFCEECRNAIPLKRLEAIPYSRLCIRCAERIQQ